MAVDPNKQRVSTDVYPDTYTLTINDWIFATDTVVAGTPIHCGPVTGIWPWSAGITVYKQPTLFGGRPYYYYQQGGPPGVADYWQVQLFWDPYLSVPAAWIANAFHSAPYPPASPTYEGSQWLGPNTTYPVGAYTAVETDGTPATCTDPLTATVTP